MLEFDFKAKVGDFELEACGRQTSPRMGLFGPSGSGKTTLLHCLAGLLRPSAGYISLDGEILLDSATGRNVPPHRRAIACVFQDGRLFPHMTVRANVEYGRQREAKGPGVAELVDVLDLKGLLDRAPSSLSGGERQRVALARALAVAPRLLLLDEPLASIDETSKLRILPYLNRIYELWRVPFVYVSHSLTEILFLTGTTWQMSRGRIVRAAHPRDLLAGSSHEVDPILNIWGGTVKEVPRGTGYAAVSCGGRILKVPNNGLRVGDSVTVALPARDLMLSLSSPRGLSARNVFPARIKYLEQNGRALWAIAETGSNELVVKLTEDAGRELRLGPGIPVYVVFKSHSVTVTTTNRGHNSDAR